MIIHDLYVSGLFILCHHVMFSVFLVFLQYSVKTWEVAVDPGHAQKVQYIWTGSVESFQKAGIEVVVLGGTERGGEVRL